MLFSKLSLFTIGCVLMDNALGDSFVYLADCGGVCFFNSSLVFRLQSLVKLLIAVLTAELIMRLRRFCSRDTLTRFSADLMFAKSVHLL